MDNDFTLYVLCLLAFIVGIVVLKKVASCIIKALILLVLAGLVVAYFLLRT